MVIRCGCSLLCRHYSGGVSERSLLVSMLGWRLRFRLAGAEVVRLPGLLEVRSSTYRGGGSHPRGSP